jgi:hypothetical protein
MICLFLCLSNHCTATLDVVRHMATSVEQWKSKLLSIACMCSDVQPTPERASCTRACHGVHLVDGDPIGIAIGVNGTFLVCYA